MLSQNKIKMISGIFANIGHVFLGSVVLPFWLNPKGIYSVLMIFTGMFVAISFWTVSVNLTE